MDNEQLAKLKEQYERDRALEEEIARALVDLLPYLFTVDELRLFIRKFSDPRILLSIPGLSASALQIYHAITEEWRRQGHLLAPELGPLLARMGGVRPEKWLEIRQFAARFAIELPLAPERLYLRHTDGSARGVRRVFISYSRDDSDWAISTAIALAHVDIEAVMDVQSIKGGEDFQERIAHELDRVDRVILGWSRNALGSDWVRIEYQQALRVRNEELVDRFLIVECLDDTPLPPELSRINARRSFFRTAVAAEQLMSGLPNEERRAMLTILARLRHAP